MDQWFALEFNIDMLSPEEQERAKNHSKNKDKPLFQILRDEGDKYLILTTKALVRNASAHVLEWGDGLVLGADGIWNIARSGQSCVVVWGAFVITRSQLVVVASTDTRFVPSGLSGRFLRTRAWCARC